MANRKIVLRFTGASPYKVAEQVKPGLRDDYGALVPAVEEGSWMVDEILTRSNALGTVSSLSLIEYKAIPYKDA